jgi:hypothetical protein
MHWGLGRSSFLYPNSFNPCRKNVVPISLAMLYQFRNWLKTSGQGSLDYMIPAAGDEPARHVSSRNAVSKPVRGTNFRDPGSLYYWSRVLAQPPASDLFNF